MSLLTSSFCHCRKCLVNVTEYITFVCIVNSCQILVTTFSGRYYRLFLLPWLRSYSLRYTSVFSTKLEYPASKRSCYRSLIPQLQATAAPMFVCNRRPCTLVIFTKRLTSSWFSHFCYHLHTFPVTTRKRLLQQALSYFLVRCQANPVPTTHIHVYSLACYMGRKR